MDVIGVQLDTAWEDKDANFAAARRLVDGAAPGAGALIVLPEMFAVGFSMNVEGIAEGLDGPTHEFLASLAGAHRAFVLAGVVGRSADGRGLNEAVLYGPDRRLLTRYAKLHPFSFAGEDRCYAPGAAPVVFAWDGFVASPAICYDLRFPETFRVATAAGANLLVVIANWPAARREHWAALLAARAIENQAYVVGVNRCGVDPTNEYDGDSVVIDPAGRRIAEAGAAPCALRARLDLASLLEYRRAFPVLDDVRAIPGPIRTT